MVTWSRKDAIPVLAGVAHFAYVILLFLAFPHLHWWLLVPLGLVYSISISWNINGISHNFLHNAYFRSPLLNRLFSLLESVTMGFSQVFYENIPRRSQGILHRHLPPQSARGLVGRV